MMLLWNIIGTPVMEEVMTAVTITIIESNINKSNNLTEYSQVVVFIYNQSHFFLSSHKMK